jgi:LemA protein
MVLITLLAIVGIIILGGIGFLLWGVAAYNGFITLSNKIEEAFSTMDVYLKKRYDLIPNLVETVKGYASHEKTTFENVTKARTLSMNANSTEERLKGEGMLTNTLKSLFAVAESYPELKANQNFLDLQQQLQGIETEIANARRYYNAVVRDYNTKREVFPSVLIASIFSFGKKPLFEVSGEDERESVKVSF